MSKIIKITEDKMQQIISTLKKSSQAINTLQRTQLHTKVDIFATTKDNVNNLVDELESRYKIIKNE
jgi:hypothetical protein